MSHLARVIPALIEAATSASPAAVIIWNEIARRVAITYFPTQFRPGPPPNLTSREWAVEYNEVKTMPN